eukprot:Partr_v1_DN28272_c3_g1_i1_m76484 putative peroxisomal biogenesis factor 11
MQPITIALIDNWVKFTATTVGRDKLYRLVQYFSKWLSHHMQQQGRPKEDYERWLRLSNAVGLGRKLFRVGKPIDFMGSILKSLSLKDDIIRYCAIGRSTCLAGWLTIDTVQWLNAFGVVKLENIQWYNKNAARCWLAGLLFAVMADTYRLRNNMQRIDSLHKFGMQKFDNDLSMKREADSLQAEQSKIVLELFQDSLDLIIPASILELVPVSQGVVGMAGTITSFIGCRNAWPKQ